MFLLVYVIGLIIGLIAYSITYLFANEIDNKQRSKVVLIVGLLILIVSLFIIGGFEGMPVGMMSLGVITISILFFLLGRTSLWRKGIYTFIISSIVFYFAFISLNQVDYWIVKKTNYEAIDDVSRYTKAIQHDPSVQGYRTFTISEGRIGVILSLGDEMAGNNIEVLNVEEKYGTIEIKIRTFFNQSKEENPMIMIGLDRLQDDLIIVDTDGTVYEEY